MTITRHVLDSNILMDFLNGIPAAAEFLDNLEGHQMISVITRMEVLAGSDSAEEKTGLELLDKFETVPLDDDIVAEATRLRRHGGALGKKVKLPDAVIYATALMRQAILHTRNWRDFSLGQNVNVPYKIETNPQEPSELGKQLSRITSHAQKKGAVDEDIYQMISDLLASRAEGAAAEVDSAAAQARLLSALHGIPKPPNDGAAS